MGTPWLLVITLGPLLLALAIAWSTWRNRKEKRPDTIARADLGAKKLREELDREDKARERQTGGT